MPNRSNSRRRNSYREPNELLKVLNVTLWAVPMLMAVIGVVYTLVQHQRMAGDPFWPWPTFLGLCVLGVIGPFLSWICLLWARSAAGAYIVSQKELAERADELAVLNELSVASSHSLDPKETIVTVLEHTMKALDANAGMVFIQENDQGGLRLEAHRGISVDMAQKEARLAPGHCLCGQAVATRKVLFASDVGDDPRCTSDLCICEGFRSVTCAPLEAKGQLIGLLQLASTEAGHFTAEHNDFLATTAAQVSISIENARLYDEVQAFNVELEQKVYRRTSELEAARWALSEKARQLQRLLGESYRIQEDTQARIAQDMHDGVTQMIIGALYETQAARHAVRDEPDLAVENLTHAQQLLTEVETEIRRAIYDLHPPVLDMMGLVVALKRFATTYTAAFGIGCEVEVIGRARRLSKETEISIYRIVQAALQNVASHALASNVRIELDFSDAWLKVVVADDGRGFEPEAAMSTPGEHLGLIGMKERAESMGASLTVDSVVGAGTTVLLNLTVPEYLD